MPNNFILDLWSWILAFLNSNFSSALAGAFFGAWGAYRFERRTKQNDDLVREVEAINAAILLASSICSSLISLKMHHVVPMYERYEKQQRHHLLWSSERRRVGSKASNGFKLEFDGLRIPRLVVPIADLRGILFDRVRLNGRPKLVISALEQALDSLLTVLEERNREIDLHLENEMPIGELVPYYLGLPTKKGQDVSFKSLIRFSRLYTDDCIWFSNRIAQDLYSYGMDVKSKNKRKKFVIIKSNYDAKTVAQIPGDKAYSSYLKVNIHYDKIGSENETKIEATPMEVRLDPADKRLEDLLLRRGKPAVTKHRDD